MSHKVKKDEKKRGMRGPTFVGCRPVVEDGKRERKENFIVDFSVQIVYNKGTKELRR